MTSSLILRLSMIFYYYKVSKANKVDQKCDNIREIIINEKNKLRSIILNKCVIINDIFYYKDRL